MPEQVWTCSLCEEQHPTKEQAERCEVEHEFWSKANIAWAQLEKGHEDLPDAVDNMIEILQDFKSKLTTPKPKRGRPKGGSK
jgi:hypothetical protein